MNLIPLNLVSSSPRLNRAQREILAEVFPLHEGWLADVAEGRVKEVQERYAPDFHAFLPTQDSKMIKDYAGMCAYHEGFVGGKPQGVYDPQVFVAFSKDGSQVLLRGRYIFNGSTDANYTFLYEKNAETGWKIVHHHSSALACEKTPSVKEIRDNFFFFARGDGENSFCLKSKDETLKTYVYQGSSEGMGNVAEKEVRFCITVWADPQRSKNEIVNVHFSKPPKDHAHAPQPEVAHRGAKERQRSTASQHSMM